MSKKQKRKRQEEQRRYLQKWSQADYTEAFMICLKRHPEKQLPFHKNMSKYARKKMIRAWEEESETNRR